MKKTVSLFISLMFVFTAFTQSGLYEPKEIKKAYDKGTRSREGIPGENYWQNELDYKLKAQLDPETRMLKGEGSIIYTNNSPDTLKYVVVKLLPNIHKKGGARDFSVGPECLNEGMVIETISINNTAQDLDNHRKFMEYGTNLYIIFDRSEYISPKSTQELYFKWNYEVVHGGIRNGAFTDSAFFIGYWYPQISVYDDVYRWDREDYTGIQETYNELGSYDVEITVPGDYVVWSTGDQINEEEVFSGSILDLIDRSRRSDQVVHILTPESYSGREVLKDIEEITWKFRATSVPDFAWACSNYYNWDACNLKLENDNGRSVWISAVYPSTSKSFDKVAEIARQSIDYLSNDFPAIPYPFNKHITFNGIHHVAVEYPMIANNSDHRSEEMYTELTIHEIAHNYIPFYMLSNERKHAWIDEGWVKLIGELYGETLGIKRENKTALNTISTYERMAGTSNDLPLILPSGFMTVRGIFYHAYAKAANANMMLLQLMADKEIENPLKEFLKAWEGKHPTPHDFFYFMNTLCGEDLAWFWNPWYFEFGAPDLGLKRGNNANEILIENLGGIPLPVILTLTYDDQSEIVLEESIWTWKEESEYISIMIPEIARVKSIVLGDPAIPDIDDSNNILDFSESYLGSVN
jgi:hypothetical protein